MSGFSLITPTGGRPESLKRCAGFVSRFTERLHETEPCPVQWIVVDDVVKSDDSDYMNITSSCGEVTYLNPKHRWNPGFNTQSLNLLAALPEVKHEFVAFIEDDDYYHANYLNNVLHALKNSDITGEITSVYYNLPQRKHLTIHNHGHVALAQTAIRTTQLSLLESVLTQGTDYIDVRFWRVMQSIRSSARINIRLPSNVIGMKGLPGRPGIGMGHKPLGNQDWIPDPNLNWLKNQIGDDIKLYPTNLIA